MSFLEKKMQLQEPFPTQIHLMMCSVSWIIPMPEKEKEWRIAMDAKMQSIDGYQWKELLIPLGKFQ